MDTHKENEYANIEMQQDGAADSSHVYTEMTGDATGQGEDNHAYCSIPGAGEPSKHTVKDNEVHEAVLKPTASQQFSRGRIILVAVVLMGVIFMFALGFVIGYFITKDKESTDKVEFKSDCLTSFECSDPLLRCDLEAASYGYDDPGYRRSYILVNGSEYPSRKGRGIHVIQLDPSNCTVLLAERFDTHGNSSHAAAFLSLLNGMKSGLIIIMTDDAFTYQLRGSETRLLNEMGSHSFSYTHRSSLIIIAFKLPNGVYHTFDSKYKPEQQGPSVMHSLFMTNGTYTNYLTYTRMSTLTL